MDSKEIRRINLEYLINSVGSIKALAELIDSNPDYISQIKGSKAKKNVGDKLARRLEKAFRKEHGWMDKLHYQESEDYSHLNNEELLSVAITRIFNQMIRSGVFIMNKKMEYSVISDLVITEYKSLLNKSSSGEGDNSKAL